MEDKSVSTCFKCDKKFNPFTRRKHHCRVCGNIFCYQCSEFTLSGVDLGDDEKELRVCEACHKKCWKYIMENDPLYYIAKKGNEDNKGSIVAVEDSTTASIVQTPAIQINQAPPIMKKYSKSDDEKLKEIRAIIAEFMIEQTTPLTELFKVADMKLSIVVQIILKANRIPFTYYEGLLTLARKIVWEVQPNAIISHNMDICKHMKIKCERGEDFGKSRVIVGTIMKKGISSKKMATNYANCSVLLVYGNIEAKDMMGKGEGVVAFEDMIENRKKAMANVLAKLKEMEVDMIFLEGAIDK